MKSFNVLILAIFFGSAFLFFSCNNLSRGKAKKVILSKIKKDDLAIKFDIGYYTGRIEKKQKTTRKGNLNELIEKGYVTLDEDNKHISLTNKISPFTSRINMTGGATLKISVAKFKDIKVTGIRGGDNNASVEYQKIYELNSLGKEINYNENLVFNESMSLHKYDDGWR